MNIDMELAEVKIQIEKNADILQHDALENLGLMDITAHAVVHGYRNSYVGDHLTAMGHACAFIAYNKPQLVNYIMDEQTGADYFTVLGNIILYCEGLF